MAQITKDFAKTIYRSGMENVLYPLTPNEQAQLAWAWLELQIARAEIVRLMKSDPIRSVHKAASR